MNSEAYSLLVSTLTREAERGLPSGVTLLASVMSGHQIDVMFGGVRIMSVSMDRTTLEGIMTGRASFASVAKQLGQSIRDQLAGRRSLQDVVEQKMCVRLISTLTAHQAAQVNGVSLLDLEHAGVVAQCGPELVVGIASIVGGEIRFASAGALNTLGAWPALEQQYEKSVGR